MYSMYCFGFTIVFPLLWTLYLDNYTKGALADSTLGCSTNFYKDGNDCKECLAGYYGDNCSAVCPPSHYGILCGQTCDCLPCHHVYGCSSTFIKEAANDDYETQDKIEDKKQASGNISTSSGRLIVIFIGSILCFILIFLIIREICLCCRFPQPTGIRTVEDVYADIAEV